MVKTHVRIAIGAVVAALAVTAGSPSAQGQPAAGAKAAVHAKQAKRLPHVMTLADITNLIAAADGERPADLRDRALLEVMYASGLRVSEAAGLDVRDVDLEQKTLLVHGKGNKERMVVMGEPARAALERYLMRGRGELRRNFRP